MHEKIITLATPVFFLLIGIEMLAARLMKRSVYRVNDTIGSLSLGIISQVTGVFVRFLAIGLYAATAERVALWHLPASSPWVWIAGLLAYDLCYYWLHRMGHEVNVLWAAHVVHHQSEAYNLSTALRQTASGALLGWIFYLPMAIAGFPVSVFAVVALIDLLYQFWIHTELIGEHPAFDRIFASPSNHRVHHAVNECYVDRNYGGILILWDRLFGTFEPQRADEVPLYGTRAPLQSFNPLWANLEVYAGMARDSWYARSWRDKLVVWFARPGWRPADVAERFPKPAFSMERERFDPHIGRAMTLYCVSQFTVMIAMAVHFLDMQSHAPLLSVALYCAYQLFALTVLGALMEGNPRAVLWEAGRLVFSAAGIAVSASWFGFVRLDAGVAAALVLLCCASLVALLLSRRTHLPLVAARLARGGQS